MPILCIRHNTDTSIDKYGRFIDALIDLLLKFYLKNQISENHVAVKPEEHSRDRQRRYQVLDRVTPQTITSSSCRHPVQCRIKLNNHTVCVPTNFELESRLDKPDVTNCYIYFGQIGHMRAKSQCSLPTAGFARDCQKS
jgi:hypothetical protein